MPAQLTTNFEHPARVAAWLGTIVPEKAPLSVEKAGRLEKGTFWLGNKASWVGAKSPSVGDKDSRLGHKNPRLGGKDSRRGDKGSPLGDKDSRLGDKGARLADKGTRLGAKNSWLDDQNSWHGDEDSRSGDEISRLKGTSPRPGDKAPLFAYVQSLPSPLGRPCRDLGQPVALAHRRGTPRRPKPSPSTQNQTP